MHILTDIALPPERVISDAALPFIIAAVVVVAAAAVFLILRARKRKNADRQDSDNKK